MTSVSPMKTLRMTIITLLAAWSATAAAAAPTIPLLNGRPKTEALAEWLQNNGAWASPDFVNPEGGNATLPTKVWIAQCAGGFLFGVRCEEPSPQTIRKSIARKGGNVWLDDSLEFFLDIRHDRRSYLHFAVNTRGVIFAEEAAIPPMEPTAPPWDPWMEVASKIEGTAWTMAVYLPFCSLPERMRPNGLISLNVCRNRFAGGQEEYSCLSPTHGSFHSPCSFMEFEGVFPPASAKAEWPHLRASISNDGELELALSGSLPHIGGEVAKTAIFEDAAGKTLQIRQLTKGELSLTSTPMETAFLRLASLNKHGDLIAISPSAQIRPLQDISIEIWQPYLDLEDDVKATCSLRKSLTGKDISVKAALVDNADTILLEKILPAEENQSFEMPVGNLPPGIYSITLSVLAPTVNICSARATFHKDPAPAHIENVSCRQDGTLLVDGSPFLPIGIYRMPPKLWGHWLKSTGFNVVHDSKLSLGRFECQQHGDVKWTTSLAEIKGALDEAHAQGLRVLFDLGNYVKNVYEVEPGEETGRRLREVVSCFRRHPALLAYYLIDEPYAHHMERSKKVLELVRSIDPQHPCIAASLGRAFYYKPTADVADILTISSYPIPYFPVSQVGHSIDMARELAGPKKTLWLAPQAVGLLGHGSLPTERELCNMTYQGLVRHTGGLIYFAWFGDKPRQTGDLGVYEPEFWNSLCNLSRELQNAKSAFFAQDDPAVAIASQPGLRLSARQDESSHYLMAVNEQERRAIVEMDNDGISAPWRDLLSNAVISSKDVLLEPQGVLILTRKLPAGQVGNRIVKARYLEPPPAQEASPLNGAFEDNAAGWSFSAGADTVPCETSSSGRCLRITPSLKSRVFAISPPVQLDEGEMAIFCRINIKVENGSGVSVEALARFYDLNGKQMGTNPLTGNDERSVKDTPWEAMGKKLEVPPGAKTLRLELGSSNSVGTTYYSNISISSMKKLKERLSEHQAR